MSRKLQIILDVPGARNGATVLHYVQYLLEDAEERALAFNPPITDTAELCRQLRASARVEEVT